MFAQVQDRSFLDASIPELLAQLRTDEKIRLLGAPNWWNTTSISRLNIPSIRMSDGPNGVRGSAVPILPAHCIPCETSMASTFNPDLIYKVGEFLAEEAKAKSAVILLAPTCNIQRSPLGGRSFESFSEDPHLSGILAAAYVNGLQSKGVSSTIKHFVANDKEDERKSYDAIVSDRALREIYLYPFMLAQKHAQPGAYMTAYNRLNGIHGSENSFLMKDVLHKEWGFDGLIMSDWFGTYSTDRGINAGLTLEMPGPPRWRDPLLVNDALGSKNTTVYRIADRVKTLLTFVQKLAKRNPDIVYGDGKEHSIDSPERRAFCRGLAAEGMVLLKNEGDVLPLKSEKIKKLAIIGPGAKGKVISGGGSAALTPSYVVTPYDGLRDNADKNIEINYALGCTNHRFLPLLDNLETPDGKPGWVATFTTREEGKKAQMQTTIIPQSQVQLSDFVPPNLTDEWSVDLTLKGYIKITNTTLFEFGLSASGRTRLYLDNELVIDNWDKQSDGTEETKTTKKIIIGETVDIRVEYSVGDAIPSVGFVRVSGAEKIDPDKALVDAVDLARHSDAAVVVVGLTPDWETEGFDRPSLELPGRQNDLIASVAKANPHTIVCVQCGSAVSMPWIADVAGLVQCWYAGNETGNALADVIYGKVNPSGRLPLTLPVRIEDVPSYLNFATENGKVHYREDLFVGYKHYQARKVQPLFPFGYGLSYTQFSISDLTIHTTTAKTVDDISVKVTVKITNTGSAAGAQVSQLYVSLPSMELITPALQLRSFAKTAVLKPGKAEVLMMTMDKYAVSFWDTPRNAWSVKAGTYGVSVGSSSADLPLHGNFELRDDFEWTGL